MLTEGAGVEDVAASSPEPVENQLRERLHGFGRIGTGRDDLDAIRVRDLEPHDADDTARVGFVSSGAIDAPRLAGDLKPPARSRGVAAERRP